MMDKRKRSKSAAKTAKYPEKNVGIIINERNTIEKGNASFSMARARAYKLGDKVAISETRELKQFREEPS